MRPLGLRLRGVAQGCALQTGGHMETARALVQAGGHGG